MASDVITYRLGSNAARRIMRAMRNEVERLRAHAVQFNGQETARFAAREAELLSFDLADMVKAFACTDLGCHGECRTPAHIDTPEE